MPSREIKEKSTSKNLVWILKAVLQVVSYWPLIDTPSLSSYFNLVVNYKVVERFLLSICHQQEDDDEHSK